MPSIQALYPTYIKLQNACISKENDEKTLKQMKTKAKTDLDKRYSAQLIIYLIASFLHPRTKDLNFVSDRDRSEIPDKINFQCARFQRTCQLHQYYHRAMTQKTRQHFSQHA